MLTNREQDALNFIRQFVSSNNMSPTIAEIAQGMGIKSSGTAHRYVQSLSKRGLLALTANGHRGITLVATSSLPVLGKISAGKLVEAVPDKAEIDLADLFAGKERFALKVNGDSMIDRAILPGDYVVIQSQKTAKQGDIVVALVDKTDATLKTLQINDDDTVTLVPANANYDPITLAVERVDIQGIVVGQLRTYA